MNQLKIVAKPKTPFVKLVNKIINTKKNIIKLFMMKADINKIISK